MAERSTEKLENVSARFTVSLEGQSNSSEHEVAPPVINDSSVIFTDNNSYGYPVDPGLNVALTGQDADSVRSTIAVFGRNIRI